MPMPPFPELAAEATACLLKRQVIHLPHTLELDYTRPRNFPLTTEKHSGNYRAIDVLIYIDEFLRAQEKSAMMKSKQKPNATDDEFGGL